MQRKLLPIGLAGLACISLLGAIIQGARHLAARADVANYVAQRRQVKACVLISDATQDADAGSTGLYDSNVTPYVFYAMDTANDLKPAGLEFVNPLAPSIINATIYQRWQNKSAGNGNKDRAFAANTSESAIFQLSQPVTKNMAAYWEENLDNLSATDLQQYDIVYLPIHNGRGGSGTPVQFTPLQREKLRHYVDAGGTVWMESTAGTPQNAFNADTFFIGVNTGTAPGAGPDTIVAGHHPLVDYPNQITLQDVYNFSILTQMNNAQFTGLATGGSARQLNTALLPIIQKNGVTTVWAGDYGAGHVVVSSAQIGSDLNNLLLSPNAQGTAGSAVVGTNDGAVSGDNLSGIPAADMKFAYNLASWLGSLPAPSANSRRTGSSQETIGSALTPKWTPLPILSTNPLEPATVQNPGSGATIYKGVTFWVDGNNWLHAYDVNPARSLNNNNNQDDGIPDLIYGAPYDEIWNDKGGFLGNPGNVWASTPTIFSQFDPVSGTLYEGAVVTTTDGVTHFYQAFPKAGNVLSGAAQALFPALSAQTSDMRPGLNPNGGNGVTPVPSAGLPYAQPSPKPAPAPAVSDGVLFTLVFANPKGTANELGWRIAAVDLLSSVRNGSPVSVFDNGQSASNLVVLAPNASFNGGLPGYYLPTGNLTVGEVKSTESDAIDRVVYVPTAADNQGTTPRSGVIHGAWFSTRNEPLTADPTDPNRQTYLPNGQRARVPWYTTVGAKSSIPLMPVVHVVHHTTSGGPTTGVNTYYYPADFDVTYKAEAGGLSHNVRIVFHNTGLVGLFDDVHADYTVDWPGDVVGNVAGSNTPSALDMTTFSEFRRYNLFSPNPQQMLTETTGGVALDSSDNLFFSETNLHDQSNSGAPLEDRIFSVRDQYVSQSTATGVAAIVRRPTAQVKWMFEPLPPQVFNQTFGSGMFNNYQTPARLKDSNGNPIYNFKAVGAPVVSNGTLYVVGLGWRQPQGPNSTAPADFSILLALNETINTSIQIGRLANPAANIALVQPSLLHPQNPITLSAADYTLEKVYDAASNSYIGVVTFSNFQASTTDGDSFNTMLPIFVRTASGNGTPVLTPLINTQTGYGLLDNLQYYVAVPTSGGGVTATSGPTVAGNVLYFSGLTANGNSTLASIDLVKAQSAGGGVTIAGAPLPPYFALPLPNAGLVQSNITGNALPAAFPSVSPPVGTTNVVVATNAQGITGLDNGLILIADNHRLLEVDAAGNAIWTMESTVSQSLVGGNLASTSGLGLKSIALSNPMTAHRTALNSFLIVDSGNNRVVGTNRGGSVNFELHGFNDDMRLLHAGDPLTLNQPADVESYVDQYPNGYSITNRDTTVTYSYAGRCTVTHYLIADSGNYRIIDVGDILDVNGNPVTLTGSDGTSAVGSKLLIFNSRSLGEQNLRYRYRTVQQALYYGDSIILSILSNVKQASQGNILGEDGSNFEGAGGSVVQLQHYLGLSPAGKQQGAGDLISGTNSIIVYDPITNTQRRQNISNPTWFKTYSNFDVTSNSAVTSGTLVPRFLLADANGCYILKVANVTLNGQTSLEYVADWMLTSDDYFYLTGRRLLATCIQKENLADLSSRNQFEPRLLITNAYSGADSIVLPGLNFGIIGSRQPTTGEVFEIKTKDYYPISNGTINKPGYGYQNQLLKRYGGGAINTVNGSITRMIPNETIVNGVLKRTIGSVGSGQTTYTIELPKYAERPL